MSNRIKQIQEITTLAGRAIVQGFVEDVIELNEVLAFDLRFNLRHPKIAALYMLETPINGAHFEVVKRDGQRYHVGGDIAAKILGEEKAYMSTLEQVATQAKEQSGLIKQFCRKCNLFDKLYPQEALEQQLKEKQKLMEEQYINRAGGVMSRLSHADKGLPPVLAEASIIQSPVSAAVAKRIHSKLRANCEIQYALAQSHISRWLDFLASKTGQVLGKNDNWKDSDPTGNLVLTAGKGTISLYREGNLCGKWDSYSDAHAALELGLNLLPNSILPLTRTSYDRTVASIPAEEAIIKKAIKSQVTARICDARLWEYLNA